MTHHPTSSSPLHRSAHWFPLATAIVLGAGASFAHADTGKLLLTGGVSTVEGAAGGGLPPWAVIGTRAAEGESGVSAFGSHAVVLPIAAALTSVAAFAQDKPQPTDASAYPEAPPLVCTRRLEKKPASSR